MIRFGVIGYGYWGPNIVRNLRALDSTQVVAVCDKSEVSLRRRKQAFPEVRVTQDASEILTSPDIDAVAVVTPVWTHFDWPRPRLRTANTSLSKSRSPQRPRRPRNSSSWPSERIYRSWWITRSCSLARCARFGS